MQRRDLILGALGVGALGVAELLRPRERLILLRNTTMDETIPKAFGGWESQAVSDLVGPEQAGRLARALYSEMVTRVYVEPATGDGVMLLVAYGDTQSDLLQLHRPESCYPAVGFNLDSARSVDLALPGGATLPARQVVASMEDRRESILYWARMGEELPQTGDQQRVARLQNAMKGYVPDGVLVRTSTVGEPERAFPILERFVIGMLSAIPRARRPALVGSNLATRIA